MSDSSHPGNIPQAVPQDEDEYNIRPDNPKHAAKIERALRLIQNAQNLIGSACQELCPLEQMCGSYGRICRLHNQIKSEWHKVNNRRCAVHPPQEDRTPVVISPTAALATRLAELPEITRSEKAGQQR